MSVGYEHKKEKKLEKYAHKLIYIIFFLQVLKISITTIWQLKF